MRRQCNHVKDSVGIPWWLLLIVAVFSTTHAFSVDYRARFAGIWKIHPVDGFFAFLVPNNKRLERANDEDEIVLVLSEDGTFVEGNAGEVGGYEGIWDVTSDQDQLTLAFDRSCLSESVRKFDYVLQGTPIALVEGQVTCNASLVRGKFMYPMNHSRFFEQSIPLVQPVEIASRFQMEQIVSSHAFSRNGNDETPKIAGVDDTVSISRFYGRTFGLTVLPIQDHSDSNVHGVDLRVMQANFFANHTFCLHGVNKLLRGRYGVLAQNDDDDGSMGSMGKLWLQVSLFGAGRSAPGSVYSEGLGMRHEDERYYEGKIYEEQVHGRQRRQMRVCGTAYFGADLGSDARPEPVGTFVLTEMMSLSNDDQMEHDSLGLSRDDHDLQ